MWTFPKPKSLADLQKNSSVIKRLKPPAELRKLIKIAVVDDQPFAPEHNLKNNRFQVETFLDIQNVSQVEEYPIILCDLQGVGSQLSEMQGAYLIEEIKKNYPEKAVIAYTGGSANSNITRRGYGAADGYLKKDASIEEWRDLLDHHITELSDPILTWQRFRLRLVRAGITPLDLMHLEHAYVVSLKQGATETRSSMQSITSAPAFDGSIAKEVRNFVASKAFDLVFEALKGAAAS